MSCKVLVIPEDPTNNGYILKPLVARILADAGKPNAKITVLSNPRLEGYDHALRAIKDELADRYGFWDLWLFMPDADRATEAAMRDLEQRLDERNVRLLCCPAIPEVEIYACVAYRDELRTSWKKVREAPRMKEDYFDPLLKKHGDSRRAGGGRDLMINESLRAMPTLYTFCPELADLRLRISQKLES